MTSGQCHPKGQHCPVFFPSYLAEQNVQSDTKYTLNRKKSHTQDTEIEILFTTFVISNNKNNARGTTTALRMETPPIPTKGIADNRWRKH